MGAGKMARKRLIIATTIILSIAAIFLVYSYVYNNYYKIDITPFKYHFLARYAESPDKQHAIGLTIHRERKNSDVTYIMGDLGSADENKGYTKDSKTIFWEKVDSKSIHSKKINDLILNDWIDIEWIDSNTVKINGITLDIHKGYDIAEIRPNAKLGWFYFVRCNGIRDFL
jgi:hypothetical protein